MAAMLLLLLLRHGVPLCQRLLHVQNEVECSTKTL